MLNISKKFFLILNLIVLCVSGLHAQNFVTDKNAIRHAVIGSIGNQNVLFIGELDGGLSCYTMEGKRLWDYAPEISAVLFEIEAADIDNDGSDELLAANANGTIYCFNHLGELLWEFKPKNKVRFSEVAVVKNNDKVQIFAGGNNYFLYELDIKGHIISKTPIEGVIRKIEGGNFIDANTQSLFVMTYAHDKFRWEFMGFLDAETKAVIKRVSYTDRRLKNLRRAMVTDISVNDINNDSKADILFFGDDKFKPLFIALNSDFDVLAEYLGNKKQIQRYAHAQGVFLATRNEIMLQYGGILMVLDTKGNRIGTSGSKYGRNVFSDFAFDPRSNQLVAAGSVDGGNNICFYDLEKPKWWLTTHKKQGRMLEVEKNLDVLYQQILNFKLPAYQKPSEKEWVMITKEKIDPKLKSLNGTDVKFVIQKSPKESTDRSHLVAVLGNIALKKDKRGTYQDTREDIIQMAKDFETRKQPFTFWAGHGNDPFYIQIETLEKILEVAPNTCYGFVYAEMDKVEDPRVIHFVEEYLPRLAKAIRKNNQAKLYFRYKNMFWAATSHLPLWKDMFFSGKYNDFLVPASEDTSNRIQDLNLAGRIGMHSGGYVNDFAMRLIDDNPTSWRPLSPGGQNSVSPYLRQGVIMAAYGARYGIVSTSGFVEPPGLNILFALMKSGVLPVVEKENIQSISSWHLIKDVDEELIHSVDNHHNLKQYKRDDDNAVFSLAQMHWAGTNIPKYDYSYAALGVKYRWLNYLPEIPNGMVPVAPIESKHILENKKTPYFVSNTKVGFSNGEHVSAKTFGDTIKKVIEKGAKRMFLTVKGASWSLVKLDENHSRLILVDPGYINPQRRKVEINFQNMEPKLISDILSKEVFKITDKKCSLNIPAGSMRFIDISY
ncbi:PQQ-like beta-propeller repeat protein [Flavivirga rizhaonensis]|uniref:WD40 repeat domain-containing protein n=1 Tax=Flavivirga rizhaonensis TaxID=2559571 RepID=A0A4S1DUV6_9FLAO|nr:PQQ-like beta-propeller repeat protein [Flavivirga rizhaonensis]TGV01866.1 hypothetical protein EM932_13595 [Flavivirga rizhaonensis]